MSGRSGWRIDARRAVACACLVACSFAAAWGIGLAFPGIFDALNGHAVDLLHVFRYRLQGRGEVSPRLVHVVVTDRSRQELGLAGWDRRAFGRALEILQRLDARTIVCDVLFKDASFAENDALLIKAAKRTGKVVFPLFVVPPSLLSPTAAEPASRDAALLRRCTLWPDVEREGNPPAGAYLVPPFADLRNAAGRLGHINVEPDRDGVNRRVPLLYGYGGALIPSLALAAALQFLEVDSRDVTVSFGRFILLRRAQTRGRAGSEIRIPIDRAGRLIVDPIGPWEDSFATVSIQTLFEADADPQRRSSLHDLMEDALVMVSDVSTMNRDHGPGVFDRVYPLSGLHMSVANSILTSSFLAEQGLVHYGLIVLGFAVVLWIAAVRMRGLAFPASCVALYAGFLGLCYWSFAGLHRVPEMASPTAGFLLGIAAIMVYRIIVAEREKSAAEATQESNRMLARVNADLTEQGKELQIANTKLREMERSREQAAENVARELRAPISSILESLESMWVGHRGGLTPPVVHDLELMRRSAAELLGLVNQLVESGHAVAAAGDGWHSDEERTARAAVSRNEEPVLLIGTDAEALAGCSATLGERGIANVIERADLDGVLPVLRKRAYGTVVLDLDPPRLAGAGLIAGIRDEFPSLQVVVLAGSGEISSAVECIRQGASDYLVKPLEPGLVVSALRRCIEKGRIEKQLRDLSRRLRAMELKNPAAFSEILTESPLMLAWFRYAEAVAADTSPVLITGESGVGKELMAGVIHRLSGRSGSFVCENIAGLDDAMLADTLFGHLKGSFTDAKETRRGLVEEASGGTLFLDEIGDMPVNSQVKLLRLIEGGGYRPLGSDTVRTSDARIVIATNVDLAKRLKEGRFREDLFYRLTHRIDLPPLRERLEDLPLLIDRFAAESARARGREKPAIPKTLIELMRSYPFPGNVRELRNMVDNAVSRSTADILPLEYFLEYIRDSSGGQDSSGGGQEAGSLDISGTIPTLKETESLVIGETLRRVGGNQSLAARLLGLSPSALSRRLRKRGHRT